MAVNAPPTLTLPTVASGGAVEANTTGGWTADWAGLGATDAEDATAPTPTCSPAAGTVLPLGTTSVTCSVADRGGLPASATFDVTVVDTTDPILTGLPASQNLTTADPTGTTLTYSAPAATDVADAAPTVGCLPAEWLAHRSRYDHGDLHGHRPPWQHGPGHVRCDGDLRGTAYRQRDLG